MSERQFRRARERRLRSKAAVAAGAGLGATVLLAPAADAATFTVSNLNDSGDGSLRDAVSDAVAADGDDVVVFQTGLSGTITLTASIPITNDGLDIQGPGPSQITVSGGDAVQIFRLYDFDGDGEPVRIGGLTLADGAGNVGGALYNDTTGGEAAELTVDNVVIRDSVAAFGGGAIWLDGGSLTVLNSTISGNEAENGSGGGLYAVATDGDLPTEVSILNSSFTGNRSYVDGGGVQVVDTSAGVEIIGSTISGNVAAGTNGGGGAKVYRNDGDLRVVDSTFAGNETGGDGGGLGVFENYSVTIQRSAFSGNTAADYGGGVVAYGNYGPLVFENTTVSANSAEDGGGIYLYTDEDEGTTIRNSTVVGNTATDDAGGVFSYGSDNPGGGEDEVTISSSIVSGNSAPTGPDLYQEATDPDPFVIGFSLIGTTADAREVVESAAGSNLLGVDPQLGPLQNNGGPTLTHAPAATSPAIDAGIANGLTTDQRGAQRTFDAANVANRTGSDATDIGSVELLPGGRLALAQCKGATETVLFTPGTLITGTDADDVVVGTPAADQIASGKGKDKVCAGAGNDSVKAGAGKDNVAGQAGKDRLKGNGGNDKLQGNAGRDTLKGGGGKDTLKGGGGKDKLRGGPGKDKLRGGGGKDSEVQ